MRIALITTWLQPCGIATYAENLAAAMVAAGHQVHAFAETTNEERDDTQSDVSAVGVTRCWHRDDPHVGQLVAALQTWRPDVIHIQHEFGLWLDRSALIRLIPMAQRVAPVVMTPHTIADRQYRELGWIWRVLERRRVPLLIHTDNGHRVVETAWVYPGELLTVIPHGCIAPADVPWPDRDVCREALGLQDRTTLLSLGFIGEGKGQTRVVRALYELIRDNAVRRHEVQYVIAGKPGGGWMHAEAYLETLERHIDAFSLRDVVDLRVGFVDADQLPTYFRAADIVVNGSQPTQYSASGRLRLAATYGRAQVVEDVELHHDMIEAGAALGFRAGSINALKIALLAMLHDRALRQTYDKAGAQYAAAHSWQSTALRHVQWYEGVCRD